MAYTREEPDEFLEQLDENHTNPQNGTCDNRIFYSKTTRK
jgi:hypothetical protein